jgi:ribonuclease G
MENSELIVDKLHSEIQYLIENQNQKYLSVGVHPYIYGYLKHGFPSLWRKWQWQLKAKLVLHKNTKLPITQYTIEDKEGDALVLAD